MNRQNLNVSVLLFGIKHIRLRYYAMPYLVNIIAWLFYCNVSLQLSACVFCLVLFLWVKRRTVV